MEVIEKAIPNPFSVGRREAQQWALRVSEPFPAGRDAIHRSFLMDPRQARDAPEKSYVRTVRSGGGLEPCGGAQQRIPLGHSGRQS
ncbi:hypothetical protein GCM10007863_34530 [Dyella mobilis]|nr:hypothetical protein GCM10007863_34530 [Dyella mobilis]